MCLSWIALRTDDGIPDNFVLCFDNVGMVPQALLTELASRARGRPSPPDSAPMLDVATAF
jgi:hypothetical protein